MKICMTQQFQLKIPETQTGWSTDHFNALPKDTCPGPSTARANPNRLRHMPSMEEVELRIQEGKVARTHQEDPAGWGGESSMRKSMLHGHRALKSAEGSPWCSAEDYSVHVKKNQRLEKNCQRGQGDTALGAHKGLRIVGVSTTKVENLITHRSLGRKVRWLLISIKEQN